VRRPSGGRPPLPAPQRALTDIGVAADPGAVLLLQPHEVSPEVVARSVPSPVQTESMRVEKEKHPAWEVERRNQAQRLEETMRRFQAASGDAPAPTETEKQEAEVVENALATVVAPPPSAMPPTPPTAWPKGSLPWEVARGNLHARLEAQTKRSEILGRQCSQVIDENIGELVDSEYTLFNERRRQERVRMEKCHAVERKKRDMAARRQELGVLDGVAVEERALASRHARHVAQQRKLEEQLAVLEERRAASEAAAKERWLATAVLHIASWRGTATLSKAPEELHGAPEELHEATEGTEIAEAL